MLTGMSCLACTSREQETKSGRSEAAFERSPGDLFDEVALAELLIDCEEDRTLRAVLVGMLREIDRQH